MQQTVMDEVLTYMREERKLYKNYIPGEAIAYGGRLHDILKGADLEERARASEFLLKELPYEYPYPAVWWYSVVCSIYNDPKIFYDFIEYVRAHKDAFSANTLFFLFYQFVRMHFSYNELDSAESQLGIWKLKLIILEEFKNKLSVSLEEIPPEKRDSDLVVVLTEQMISARHSPSLVALDRCRAIVTGLNKKVILINTAESLSIVGQIPFMEGMGGNYVPEGLNQEYKEWKGIRIPYFQCEMNMPNVDTINLLLAKIREMAPSRIVSIGGTSIVSNLADKIVPVVTIGLGTELEYTYSTFQTMIRKKTDSDRMLLREVGLSENHVIESVFTFGLEPQTEKITKAELGVDEEKFLMMVAGGRLDAEVSDEFLMAMDQIINDKMVLGFFGVYEDYEAKVQKYRNLAKNSMCFAFCSDFLSRMEVCDLFVNPKRKGGGTSCVQAMYMGVPVVTIGYGDVAINAGEAFCVNDYEEMKAKVIQYYEDQIFYKEMSELAKKRAEILLDTETEFIRIMKEADRRENANMVC